MYWKLPPRIKIMEALGAIADGRIKLLSQSRAEVTSSDGTRKYEVRWDPSTNSIISTDNGSMFRGYIGYPAIAFLMIQGVLPYDAYLGNKLAGIPWRKLNERYRKYELVMEEILKKWNRKDRERLEKYITWIMRMLREMKLKKLEEKVTLADFI